MSVQPTTEDVNIFVSMKLGQGHVYVGQIFIFFQMVCRVKVTYILIQQDVTP